jgi:hypothetical protein
MRFKKKDLISLLEDINEMPMDFDSEDRPHDDIQRALSTGDTPLKKIPFPKTGEEPNKNFQELLASERYRQVVEKLRELTGSNITLSGNEQDMAPLIRMMQYAHNEIISAESEHKSQLIELAVRLAVDEIPVLRKSELETLLDDDNGGLEFNDGVYRVFYRLPDGSKKYKIQYDAKIVSIGGVSAENFNREMEKQPNIEPVDVEKDLADDLFDLDLEKAKRRFINAIIQGVSKRGHYMYSFVVDKIREITGSDTLTNNYGILMSINDTLYWQLSDDRMKGMMGGGGIGGKQQVKRSTKPPTVVVEAVNFPILVHELIKGTYEIFGTQGRPKDKEGKEDPRFADVEKSEDTLEKEVWDLRLGPAIYDRLRKQFPDEIFDDEEQYFLQNYLITSIFKLPAKQFLVFTKEVLSNSEDGKRLMSELLQGIVRMLRKLEYQQAMLKFNQDLEQVSDNINKTDLRDFLGDMGIRLSDDDDDPVGPTD